MDQLMDRRRFLRGLAATAAAAATAPAPAFARTASRYVAVEAMLEGFVAAGRVPGAILAIVRPGAFRPDYVATGRTAFYGGRAVDRSTLWRIYSQTKPVTGVATVLEAANGRFGMDTPLGELMREYRQMRVLLDPAKGLESRPAEQPIRVRHLLTHMAGLSYHIAGDGPLEREYRRLGLLPIGNLGLRMNPLDGPVPDLDTFATRLAGLPLRYEPGRQWHYSVSLDLAGAMLQRVTGRPFDRLLEERLFRPMGMRDTGFVVPAAAQPRLSTMYGWIDPATGKRLEQPVAVDGPVDSAWGRPPPLPAGGAGLVSSAEDYARFAQMLLNDGQFEGRTILPRAAVRLATSNLMPPGLFFNRDQGFGAGGAVTLFDRRAGDPKGYPADLFRWGGAAGTLYQHDPVRQVGVVLMLQIFPAQTFPTDDDLQTALNRDLA